MHKEKLMEYVYRPHTSGRSIPAGYVYAVLSAGLIATAWWLLLTLSQGSKTLPAVSADTSKSKPARAEEVVTPSLSARSDPSQAGQIKRDAVLIDPTRQRL